MYGCGGRVQLARHRNPDRLDEAARDVRRMGYREVAGPTRLELATSGVTGQRSNQLNYDPAMVCCARTKIRATPGLVGGAGIEPATAGV